MRTYKKPAGSQLCQFALSPATIAPVSKGNVFKTSYKHISRDYYVNMNSTGTTSGSASRIYIGDAIDTRIALSGFMFGTNISCMLLAFIIAQTYTYHQNSTMRKDSRYIQIGVYGLAVFQTMQTGADIFAAYPNFVFNWGNSDANDDLPSSVVTTLTLVTCALTGLAVQSFYIVRIWKFSTIVSGPMLKFITGCMCIFTGALLLLACGSAVAFTVIAYPITTIISPAVLRLWQLTNSTWGIASAIADCIISISMIVILFHARSKASFEETRSRFSKTLRAIVQTGFITTALAIFFVGAELSSGHIGAFDGFPPCLIGKSYVISFLSVLNARVHEAAVVQGSSRGSNPTTRPVPMASGPVLATPGAMNLETTTHKHGLVRRICFFAKTIKDRGLKADPRSTDLEFQIQSVPNRPADQ